MAQRIATVTTPPVVSCSKMMARSSGTRMQAAQRSMAYRWSVNTAIYVSRTHQRRGAGRALYSALFDLLRRLGHYKAIAGITLPNPASVGLHEAMGFELAGVYRDIGYKLGAWRDVAWYQASIQPVPPEPPEPRGIATLHGTAEWDDAVRRGVRTTLLRTRD